MNRSKNKHVWIIGLGSLVRLPLVFLPMTYGHEVWRQADTASIAHHFFVNGYRLFLPQIFWGGAGPGYVETEFQILPFVVALLYGVFGEHVWLGRLVAMLCSIGTALAFWAIARRLLDEKHALWALAFFVLTPLNIRYDIAFMPEAPLMLCYVFGLASFLKWRETGSWRSWWAMASAFALAFLLKATVIYVGLFLIAYLVTTDGWSTLRNPRLWLAGALALFPGALWYSYSRTLFTEYGNTFGILSGGDSKFGSITYWLNSDFYLSTFKLEVVWVFWGGGMILFLLGLLSDFRGRNFRFVWLGYGTVLLFYLAVARYAGANWGVHYHLFATPFAALGTAVGLRWLKNKGTRGGGKSIGVVAVLLLLVSAFRVAFQMVSQEGNWNGRRLVACAERVAAVVPNSDLIIVGSSSADNDRGTPNNYQDPTVFVHAKRYGWSLPSNRYDRETVEQFRQQGAKYFVDTDSSLFHTKEQFAAYIKSHASLAGGGYERGCAIYRFSTDPVTSGEPHH